MSVQAGRFRCHHFRFLLGDNVLVRAQVGAPRDRRDELALCEQVAR